MADPQEPTIKDLFRVINDMRAEMRDGFEKADVRHAEVKSELQAIRDVVDNDLASQGQVTQLEGKMTDLQRAARQNGQKIDKLATRMDRAGIPAE